MGCSCGPQCNTRFKDMLVKAVRNVVWKANANGVDKFARVLGPASF